MSAKARKLVIVLCVVVGLGSIAFSMVFAPDRTRKNRSAENLREIGDAIRRWTDERGQKSLFPASLRMVYETVLHEADRFIAPGSGSKPSEDEFVSDYESILERAGFPVDKTMANDDLPLAWEKVRLYRGGRNVLFFGGHVEFVAEARVEKLLGTVDEVLAKHRPK